DRSIRIALLKLHPDSRADRRHHVNAHWWTSWSSERNAGFGPGGWQQTHHVGYDKLKSSGLQRVDVLQDGAAILSEVFSLAHTSTFGVVVIKPSRLSEKFCLYSPRLML